MVKRPVTKKAPKAKAPAKKASKKVGAKMVEVFSILHPGKTYRCNAEKYAAARKAFFGFMPSKAPGLTQAEMLEGMRKALPDFGSTAGWWMKTVQLDAEARKEVVRDGGKPLRWRKVK